MKDSGKMNCKTSCSEKLSNNPLEPRDSFHQLQNLEYAQIWLLCSHVAPKRL